MDVYEEMRYASLWFTKEMAHTEENNILFLVMVMDMHMVVNRYPRLSLSLYKIYHHIAEFKVEFHRVYVKVRKDPMETWHPLPYLVMEYDRLAVVQDWPEEWMTPPSGMVGAIGT